MSKIKLTMDPFANFKSFPGINPVVTFTPEFS